MSPITLPPGLPPASLPPTPQTAVLATVPDPSPAIAGALVGTIIKGTVVGRDASGLVVIRTDKGTLALATQANLPAGSSVALEVRIAGARLQLVVLAIEPPAGAPRAASPAAVAATGGGPPAPFSTPAGGTPTPAPAGPAAAVALLAGGGLVTATVIQPASPRPRAPRLPGGNPPDSPAPTAPRPPAPAGSAGRSPLGGPPTGPAAPPPTIPAAAASGQAPSPPVSGPPAPSPSVPGPPPSALPPPPAVGSEIALRVVALTPPAAAAPAAPAFAGLVVSLTPTGHPIVASPLGTLVLDARTDLPAGSTIILEVAGPSKAPAPATPASPLSAAEPWLPLLAFSRDWPALSEAAETLTRAGPAAEAALVRQLPQTGPRLAAGLLSLLGALGNDDADGLLAPALREALERVGRTDLVKRLRDDFAQIARLAAEPIGGDWRVLYLPLHDGTALRQINLYLRGRRRPAGGAADADAPTRFVLEVELGRLGPLQFDGLVNRRRFDLMLRSRAPLPASMRRDIEAIFDEARTVGGFAGAIAFQTAAVFPVAPLEEAVGRHAGVVV